MGAEFIHGRPPSIWELIERGQLPVVERAHEIHRPGGEQNGDGMWRLMDAMETAAERGADESFAAFAERAPFPEQAKRAATSYVEGFNAARADVVSIQALAQESKAADKIDGDRAFHLPNGYDAIARALLPVRARLYLNTAAERIEWSPGRAIAHVRGLQAGAGGGEGPIEARHLIVTVSLGVLQASAIAFDPAPEALAAANELAFGDAVRVTLRFETPLAFVRPGFLLSDEPVFPTWWSTLPVRAPVITGWSAGPKADLLLGLPKAAIVERALDSLRRITRADLPPVAAAYFHDWRGDPFFRGAYSYVPAGKLNARSRLAAPIANTLYFAGEAANLSGHGGTVHGAIESGALAAQRVIAHARAKAE